VGDFSMRRFLLNTVIILLLLYFLGLYFCLWGQYGDLFYLMGYSFIFLLPFPVLFCVFQYVNFERGYFMMVLSCFDGKAELLVLMYLLPLCFLIAPFFIAMGEGRTNPDYNEAAQLIIFKKCTPFGIFCEYLQDDIRKSHEDFIIQNALKRKINQLNSRNRSN
jgi:hypothetical protein